MPLMELSCFEAIRATPSSLLRTEVRRFDMEWGAAPKLWARMGGDGYPLRAFNIYLLQGVFERRCEM